MRKKKLSIEAENPPLSKGDVIATLDIHVIGYNRPQLHKDFLTIK